MTTLDFGSVAEGGDYSGYLIVTNTSSGAIQVVDQSSLSLPYTPDATDHSALSDTGCEQVSLGVAHWPIVGSGKSCKVWFLYAPRDEGASSVVGSIGIAPGGSDPAIYPSIAQTFTVFLRGSAVAPSGAPSATSTSPVTFPTSTLHGTGRKFATVSNTSRATEQIGYPTFSAGSPFAGVPLEQTVLGPASGPYPQCSSYSTDTQTVLAPGQSCSLSLGFTPTKVGAVSATMKIGIFATDAAGNAVKPKPQTPTVTVSVTLKGTGVTPLAAASPLNFGSETVTSTKTVAVVLSNPNDDVALQYGEPTLPAGVFAYTGPDSNNCKSVLASTVYVILPPRDSCSVLIRYSPTAIASSSATMSVPVWSEPLPTSFAEGFFIGALPDRAPDLKAAFVLKGAGVAPVIRPSNSTPDFGTHTVGSTTGFTETLTNLADAYVFVTGPTLASTSPFKETDAGASGCDQPGGHHKVLSPHASCTMRFEYTPLTITTTSTAVKVNVYFSRDGNDDPTGLKVQNTVALTLKGKSAAVSATLSPSPLVFTQTSLGDSRAAEVFLDNTSDVDITVDLPVVPARTAFRSLYGSGSVLGVDCVVAGNHAVIPAGWGCSLWFLYQPVAAGTTSTTARVALHAASGALASPIKVAATLSLVMKGTGVAS